MRCLAGNDSNGNKDRIVVAPIKGHLKIARNPLTIDLMTSAVASRTATTYTCIVDEHVMVREYLQRIGNEMSGW